MDKSACCVIMASQGYPGKYEGGYEITVESDIQAEVYVAGAKLDGGKLVNAGGRVLGVTAVGNDLSDAINKAYANVPKVSFANAYYRKDIGAKALRAKTDDQ